MDDRSKSALGLGGVGVGWLALTPVTTTGMAVLAVLWLGLAIAWWFDESTFAVPVDRWHEEGGLAAPSSGAVGRRRRLGAVGNRSRASHRPVAVERANAFYSPVIHYQSMDDPEDVADEGGQWEHPSPAPDERPPEGGDEADPPAVSSSAIDTEPTEQMPDPPTLPDALFADDPADDQQIHWYVREDAAVLVLANREIDREEQHAVATSSITRTADGDFEWEIPAALIRGHAAAAAVPDKALLGTGRSIHFRASQEMLDGPIRTCYAMTDDRLNELTGQSH